MKKLFFFSLLFIHQVGFPQDADRTLAARLNDIKLYPSNWWVGMKNPHLQILVRGKNVGKGQVFFFKKDNPYVRLDSIQRLKNPNYIFLNFTIGPEAKAGRLRFCIHILDTYYILGIPLEKAATGNGITYARGIHSDDFIYLVMPDRFSNGDPNNDHYANMLDTVTDRKNPLARHGGDMQGVINHLDYIRQLGATAIWLTPVIENNMPLEKESAGWMSGYHGYWFTDHYEIDKRLGGKEAYLKLVQAAHAKGLKIIQDAVYNHIGASHWFMSDPPTDDWINRWPEYQNTNHREQAVFDIHASPSDKEIMEAGWFVPHLPDLNLRNPLLATYLIQQAIWMTQTFQLDGWRVDTYKYCDPIFLNKLNDALEKEFPSITSLGEATVNSVAAGAYFCRNNLNVSWKSNLTGILDFPVCYAMLEALKKNYGWSDGAVRLYTTIAEDMLYKDPMNNCIFLDNHDMDRFYSVIGEDSASFKMGIGLLLTERGIPHLYYGTEILMKNFKNPSDAMVREDFPGGFPGDPKNKFMDTGRTESENAAFNFVSRLANFRKTSSAIKTGKLMHYIPSRGMYVYFRYDDHQTLICALNTDTVSSPLHFNSFPEMTRNFGSATDVIDGNTYVLSEDFMMPPRSIRILELKKRETDNKVVH
jgi:neopullulanase